jgi:hypothetical protein
MKKTALALLLLLSLNACKKDDAKPAPAIDNVSINGLRDLTMNFTAQDSIGLDLRVTDPTQQPKVTLSIEGLPAGIGCTFTTASGYPSFQSGMLFSLDSIVTPGTYPLKLTASIAGEQQTKSFDFKLTVPAINGIMVNDSFIAVTGSMNFGSFGSGLVLDPYWVVFGFHKGADLMHMASYKLVGSSTKFPDEANIGGSVNAAYLDPSKPPVIKACLSADSSKMTIICPRIKVGKTTFLANFTIPVTR